MNALDLARQPDSASENAPAVAAVRGVETNKSENGREFTGVGSDAALDIERKAFALAWPGRVRTGTVLPGELNSLMSFLTGSMRRGACAAIGKAMRRVAL